MPQSILFNNWQILILFSAWNDQPWWVTCGDVYQRNAKRDECWRFVCHSDFLQWWRQANLPWSESGKLATRQPHSGKWSWKFKHDCYVITVISFNRNIITPKFKQPTQHTRTDWKFYVFPGWFHLPCCHFLLLIDVNEWINNECAECVLPHLNIRDWSTRSHPSKGESCTRNRSESCKCQRAFNNIARTEKKVTWLVGDK
jgi:hypothetical protein